ncbi:MAG: hypothetical protein OHK0012_27800 [Synechococcales cyanobacterium]
MANRFGRWLALLTMANVLLVSLVLGLGGHAVPQVRGWSWEGRWVTAADRVLFLRFNRVMNLDSVAASWQSAPPLPGRWQSQGQTLAYTLTQPVRYGQTYTLTLDQATDEDGQTLAQPWQVQVPTPPRRWVTLAVSGEHAGQLLAVDLDVRPSSLGHESGIPKITILTSQPVQEFQAAGETVAFLAQGDLYTWRQGRIQRQLRGDPQTILRFRLSVDGELLLAERLDPRQAGVTHLWQRSLSRWGSRWQPLEPLEGGDFLITPDNNSLLISQGQGLGLVPIQGSRTDITFLARFGQALFIQRDGTAAAMVEFLPDYQRVLWLVTNTGQQKPIFAADGSILSAVVDPVAPVIYSLVTVRDPETLVESPVLLAIDWQTGVITEIAEATFPEELSFALAPDGSGLIYSRMTPGGSGIPITPSGQAVASAATFWVPLDHGEPQLPPQPLGIAGAGVGWLY